MRRWLFRLTALVAGLVLGLLLVELALRVLPIGPQPVLSKRYLLPLDTQGMLEYHCYPSDPHGEFTSPPETSQGRWRLIDFAKHEYPLAELRDTPHCVEYRFEYAPFSRGLFKIRDRKYEARPADGVLRIAAIGDSFVFGEGVPIERTLGRQLEAKLGPDFEVINASQSGLQTDQEVELARLFAGEFGCRRAIVVFLANDVVPSQQLLDRQNLLTDLVNVRDERVGALRRHAWNAGPSRLANLIFSRDALTRVTDMTIQWYLDCYDPAQNADGLARLADAFRQLAAIDDCQVALVMYPLLEGLEGNWPLAPIHARVGQMAREAGLPVLDLAPAFAGQTTNELWVHTSDHHPNGRANAIAVEAILKWLKSDAPEFLKPEAPAAVHAP
ncbi:MAG: hypothetical protein K2Y37_08785 [Pirellulales bacterium]|nr:hypothetical protein [Pirellulales bacterium]